MDEFNNTWFDKLLQDHQDFEKLRQHPVAYFCAEFALSDMMPIYSGGLGVLAGDIIRQADELGIPFVGIGLLYKNGFFKQTITDDLTQQEDDQPINPRSAGLSLVLNSEGNVFVQSIPINGRKVSFQTWHVKVGTVDMYFLDTDVDANTQEDRAIIDSLYGGDTHTRLLQEIILGIGGEKTLFAQGIYPSVYHMNEGHSAFAAFGIVHHYMKLTKSDFETAYREIHKKLIFTNHTLVPAGNDLFSKADVETHLSEYAQEVQIPLDAFVQKGLLPDGQTFSMTIFALHLAFKVNAVSVLHAKKATEMWPDYDIIPITNGVHIQSWQHPLLNHKLQDIALENHLELEQAVDYLSKGELWKIHQELKDTLLKEVFTVTGSILDKDILTITWARRIAEYKRPDLIFLDMERLKAILTNTQHPVQIIMAGKPHPHDTTGKSILHNILQNIHTLNQPNRIVFLPNYSISLAKFLVSGSDMWLNSPIRGYEASGTSSIKSGANGALQFTVQDGWTAEVDWTNIGWIIDENDSSQSLYSQIENDISATYYNRRDGISEGWIDRMIRTMKITIGHYSTKRTLGDYMQKLYLPSIQAQV